MSEQAEKGEWPSTTLPGSWSWVSFNDAWSDSTDSTRKLKQKEYLAEGPLPVVDQGESLVGGYTDRNDLKNDVALPCIVFGDHTRAVKFIDFEFAQGADGVKVLQPNGQYDPEFAYQALRCVRLPNKGYSRHFKFLKSTAFPIPPLPEQRRIVAKLDRLSARSVAARDHLARTTKLATRAKQAILTEAFRGGVSSQEHREYGDRKAIDTPFTIPAAWNWKTAEELCEWITKGTTPKRDEQSADCGDVPFIKVYNLTFDGSLDFTKEPTFVSRHVHEGLLKRSKVFPGDILMNIVGPPLGKVSIVPETHSEWNMNQAIAVFRAKDKILPAFLAKWLLSEAYLSWATALSKATAGQRNLTLEICRRSPVPVPPLDEQREIVRRIEAAFARIDRLTEEASRAAHLLDRLDERLLAKAFRGELVPQHPGDEPARVLLTRIREARAAAPKPKRGRRKHS